MKIMIDIPDGCYEELWNGRFPIQDAYRLVTWIRLGTPLYYKPITIREKDSEPRTLKALVNERTNEVYIRQFTLDYWESVKGCEVITDADSD